MSEKLTEVDSLQVLNEILALNQTIQSTDDLASDEVHKLLKLRLEKITTLFSQSPTPWLEAHLDTLNDIQLENESFITRFQDAQEELKQALLKAKHSQKSIDAYKKNY
jgi:hypothetical protein